MGVVIRGSAVTRPVHLVRHHGARRLADHAIKKCLTDAGAVASDLDLLVNTGVYRERGLGEPALAALVQDDVRANRTSSADGHGTFSFDIDNGMCGVLTAVDVVRGFLTSGAIETGMIVASDSAPGPLHTRAWPRPEAGGALLLGLDETEAGFSAVRFATYPEYAGLIEGYWAWRDGRVALPRRVGGGNSLVVRQRRGFTEQAARCAAELTTGLLATESLGSGDVDLMIAVAAPGFADRLADALGVSHDRTLHVGEQVASMHTAQPIAAINYAQRSGRWSTARTILLVCAGSGITVTGAIYRR